MPTMRDAEITKIFGLSQQTIQNWKKGRSGDGKVELYRLLSMLGAEKVRQWLKQDIKDTP
jgi:hypothetical protein